MSQIIKPTITEFFNDRDIFVTGGTGLIGKTLIEKLLRSCSRLRRIFILIREKQNMTISKRLDNTKMSEIFEYLRNNYPSLLEKLVPIRGDISETGLGIGEEDRIMMKNVSVIYHVAATVKFNETLKYAVTLNVKGTLEVMRFAEQLPNLVSLVHVSTAFINPADENISEELYPPSVDWKKTLKIVDETDENIINAFTKHYINFLPNTYTFTKALAEQVVNSYKDVLPLVIFRPSVVVATGDDPFPGWFDSFMGPVAFLCSISTGLSRTMFAPQDSVLDYVPVDIVVRSMIISSWVKGVVSKPNDIPIYNCATALLKPLKFSSLIKSSLKQDHIYPCDKMIWKPSISFISNSALFYFHFILFNLFPSMAIDLILFICRIRPFALRIQRRLYNEITAIKFFTFNRFYFHVDNFMNLLKVIPDVDRKEFQYDSLKNATTDEIIMAQKIACRRFLLKETDDTLPRARKLYKLLYAIDLVLKLIIFGYFFYWIVFKKDIFGYMYNGIINYIDDVNNFDRLGI